MARYSFYGQNAGIADPAEQCFEITPDDDDPLPITAKSFRADGDGVVTLRAVGSTEDVAHPVIAGEIVNVICSHIRATGTTGQTTIIGYA